MSKRWNEMVLVNTMLPRGRIQLLKSNPEFSLPSKRVGSAKFGARFQNALGVRPSRL